MKHTLIPALLACSLTGPALANGRNPGSLLIYPEIRTGNGFETIVTVTNTHPTQSVIAHFKYVDADPDEVNLPCGITNVTKLLQPLDTFTAVVSQHIPGGPTRGYLWVVAENPVNRAVSFNYLAGDLLIVDGNLGSQYSVEPLPFSSPKAFNTPTDSEPAGGDGIRDLNGIEYEKAPARVHVPRFMGQSGTYTSELVLIGLSGGRRFTTIVDFLAFNDNEEIFSAQYAFDCWTKVDLNQVNGIFSRNFLRNATAHAPAEIVGANMQETGFFFVEGNVAVSHTTDIFDPAILAVLIERSGPTSEFTAELPFFEGVCGSGDLLPSGNSWDGD